MDCCQSSLGLEPKVQRQHQTGFNIEAGKAPVMGIHFGRHRKQVDALKVRFRLLITRCRGRNMYSETSSFERLNRIIGLYTILSKTTNCMQIIHLYTVSGVQYKQYSTQFTQSVMIVFMSLILKN